jgi:hypothetical protein
MFELDLVVVRVGRSDFVVLFFFFLLMPADFRAQLFFSAEGVFHRSESRCRSIFFSACKGGIGSMRSCVWGF